MNRDNNNLPDWQLHVAQILAMHGYGSSQVRNDNGNGASAGADTSTSALIALLASRPPARESRDAQRDTRASTGGVTDYREAVNEAVSSSSAAGLPETPSSPVSSDSASSSSSEYEDDSIFTGLPLDMDTNVKLTAGHFDEMSKILMAKAGDIKTYEQTNNYSIQHLDWPAGNPADPALVSTIGPGATSASDGGKPVVDDEDRANQEKIARMVARITFGVEEKIDPKHQFSKSLFFGDWLAPPSGEKEYFIEIQVKRVKGYDAALLEECGVNPELAFLSMRDVVVGEGGAVTIVDPKKGIAAVDRQITEVARAVRKHSKADGKRNVSDCSSTSADTSSTGDAGSAQPATTVSAIVTPPGFPSRSTTRADVSTGDGEPLEPPEAIEGMVDGFPIRPTPFIPLQRVPAKLDAAATRANFRKELMKHFEHLEAKVPAPRNWTMRVANSFIYMVKVIGIPRPAGAVNTFTGPVVADRNSTLLAMGGWVVPPLEERAAYRAANPHLSPKPAKRPHGVKTKPSVQRAMPTKPDISEVGQANAMGEFPPLWMEVGDPTLEDVYWMVWELYGGRQFVGFRCGTAFGVSRKAASATDALAQNPFRSPSREAVSHSATLERASG